MTWVNFNNTQQTDIQELCFTHPTASVVPSGEYRQHSAFVTLATWHGTSGLYMSQKRKLLQTHISIDTAIKRSLLTKVSRRVLAPQIRNMPGRPPFQPSEWPTLQKWLWLAINNLYSVTHIFSAILL